MQILTQKNANVAFAIAATWEGMEHVFPNLLPVGISHYVEVLFWGLSLFCLNMGFTRTSAGNILPPAAIHEIDRQATLARAGDAVVEAVAQKVTEDAKKP